MGTKGRVWPSSVGERSCLCSAEQTAGAGACGWVPPDAVLLPGATGPRSAGRDRLLLPARLGTCHLSRL